MGSIWVRHKSRKNYRRRNVQIAIHTGDTLKYQRLKLWLTDKGREVLFDRY